MTQKFVILVPDPIVYAPWSVLLDCTTCFVSLVNTPFAGLFVIPRNKDDMGDGVPMDQLSHNHCDCTDSHCRSHIVAPCVCLCFSSQPLSQDDGGGYLPQCLRGGWHQGRCRRVLGRRRWLPQARCFLVVISQDTSVETVLWIHLFLRALSQCEVSPQLLDGNDGADCVKSSSDAVVRTMFHSFFASVTCLALLFLVMSTHRTTHGHQVCHLW